MDLSSENAFAISNPYEFIHLAHIIVVMSTNINGDKWTKTKKWIQIVSFFYNTYP